MFHAEFVCNGFWCDFFIDLFFESCFMTNLEVFIDILLIYMDYFKLKYVCVLPMCVIECKSIIMK